MEVKQAETVIKNDKRIKAEKCLMAREKGRKIFYCEGKEPENVVWIGKIARKCFEVIYKNGLRVCNTACMIRRMRRNHNTFLAKIKPKKTSEFY